MEKNSLGDFNVNFLDETDSQHLKQMMNAANYSQIVKGTTFVSSNESFGPCLCKAKLTGQF